MRKLTTSVGPAAVLFTLLANDGASAAKRVTPDAVSVHLFLEKSGQLSPDITAISDFHSWNFEPSGEGIPEGEKFNGILIKVRLRSDGEVFAKGEQARLTVRSVDERKIIRTERIADVYIEPGGIGYRAFYVPDVACMSLAITVAAPSQTIRKALKFACGE